MRLLLRFFQAQVVLATVLVVAAATTATAQQTSGSQTSGGPRQPGESLSIGFGLKSGVVWPSFNAVSDGFGDQHGALIGAFIDVYQRRPIGATGDILYVNTPQRNKPGAPIGNLKALEIPVMLRVRQALTANKAYAVYGIAGPAFTLKLSGDDAYANQTVDFVLGGGLDLKNLMLEARVNRGSRDYKIAGVTHSETEQSFSILIAFRVKP